MRRNILKLLIILAIASLSIFILLCFYHRSYDVLSVGQRIERAQLIQFERELEIGVYLNRIESWWFQNTMAMRLSFSDGTRSRRIGHPIGGEYQSVGMKYMGITQDFLGRNNEARKYGFSLMSTFYDLLKTS